MIYVTFDFSKYILYFWTNFRLKKKKKIWIVKPFLSAYPALGEVR